MGNRNKENFQWFIIYFLVNCTCFYKSIKIFCTLNKQWKDEEKEKQKSHSVPDRDREEKINPK